MPKPDTKTVAEHQISLQDRYKDSFVNDVFKDNILLAINYGANKKVDPTKINWDQLNQPVKESITLKPGETFAFHDDVLPEYEGKIAKTMNSHFDSTEGYKSDGYLVGDGVCHLASIMYWVAKDAGLDTTAPTRHDFAPVPDVPPEYGVSIYDDVASKSATSQLQNLYIKNNKDKAVTFEFDYDGKNLAVKAEEKI
jgi:hypothetical protein